MVRDQVKFESEDIILPDKDNISEIVGLRTANQVYVTYFALSVTTKVRCSELPKAQEREKADSVTTL